jgi:(E)-4-hydroxy-3-methylbut-2-enyl-diphosphate synthase
MGKEKRIVRVGNRELGGDRPILIQTMADIKTDRVKDILAMDKDLKELGNDLLRLSVLDMDDAYAFKELSENTDTPLIADIHFNYRFALCAVENGASAIRINPGNIGSKENLRKVIEACKERHVPMRIGVNSGSLPSSFVSKKDQAEAYISLMKQTLKVFDEFDYHDLVLSLKSSDPEVTYEAYKRADEEFDYPLHIGVTEAGEGYIGAIRSCVGLVPLLREGIGNTIRISLTDAPRNEVIAAKELLKAMGLRKHIPVLVSCPTCGRTQVDLKEVALKVEKYLEKKNVDVKVAVMGCPVNGPGEARDADFGLAGGVNTFLTFKKGKAVASMSEKDALNWLFKEIDNFREGD